MFRFKQFNVDQTGCAMKINTDGVLLGAIATAENPSAILDIGTGTGVIALMLAQRFARAKIDAVEIDGDAAKTADRNFKASPFANRLTVYDLSFENYFEQFPDKKYDLIISNPPFYINSLKSPGARRSLAKHTDIDFFERLVNTIAGHLALHGGFWLILPAGIAETVISFASSKKLYPIKLIQIRSYAHSLPHRIILHLAFERNPAEIVNLIIYEAENIYSEEYQSLLKPYFLTF